MSAVLDLPPLSERANTKAMRKLLCCVAECERSLIEIRLPRLARKMGDTAGTIEVHNLITTAEIAGWIECKTNSLGYVMDVWLTPDGSDLIGHASFRIPTRESRQRSREWKLQQGSMPSAERCLV